MTGTIIGGMDRRQLLKVLGISGAMLGGGSTLTACGSSSLRGSASGASTTLKIGLVSPQTGPLASFASADSYVVEQVSAALSKGLTIGGTKRSIEIVVRDTQSNPTRATEVTKQLISEDLVDIVVGSGTPDTTNPVADQCEASGIPNVTTIAPWEAWYMGRGGEGEGFTYTTLFFFGMQQFDECFGPMWERMDVANNRIAALWPDDTDVNAFRAGLTPLAAERGFEMVDGGGYQNGANDFNAQLGRFKDSGAELFTCTPIPPDFAAFWKQAQQQDFRPKLATVAKVMLFPSEAEALGELSNNIATDIWWSPSHPYTSSIDGTTAKQLADGFAESTGNQWTQALGSVYSLFEIAVEAFKGTDDPKDHDAVAEQLRMMNTTGMSGPLDFTAGPQPGIAIQHPVGGQWRPGTDFPWDITIVDNTANPDVPVGGDLEATNT